MAINTVITAAILYKTFTGGYDGSAEKFAGHVLAGYLGGNLAAAVIDALYVKAYDWVKNFETF